MISVHQLRHKHAMKTARKIIGGRIHLVHTMPLRGAIHAPHDHKHMHGGFDWASLVPIAVPIIQKLIGSGVHHVPVHIKKHLNHRHHVIAGIGFWDDFAKGFVQGFTGTLKAGLPVLAHVAGLGIKHKSQKKAGGRIKHSSVLKEIDKLFKHKKTGGALKKY